MKSFAIVIATHGHESWEKLARERAYPSALAQDVPIFIGHDPDVDRATIRNRLAEEATSDFLVFLDGDDLLEPGYIANMARAAEQNLENWPLLLTPKVSYIKKGIASRPNFWPEVPMRSGNWMVVGTAVPRDLFFEVGGWRSLTSTGMLNEYDDWDLWIRCQIAGATPVRVPGSVYVAHIRADSVHRTVSRKQKLAWTAEIQQANWPHEMLTR